MATRAVLQVGLALEESPTSLAAELDEVGDDRTSVLRFVERVISRVQHRGHKLAVRVDSATDSTNYALDRAAPTITITFANITAGETIVIGNKTLTWAVAAANENEVTIGADLAAATTNLTAAINDHTALKGIFLATGVTATGVVTVKFCGDPRIGALIGLSETGDAVAVSAANFALTITDAYASASYLFSDGGLR